MNRFSDRTHTFSFSVFSDIFIRCSYVASPENFVFTTFFEVRKSYRLVPFSVFHIFSFDAPASHLLKISDLLPSSKSVNPIHFPDGLSSIRKHLDFHVRIGLFDGRHCYILFIHFFVTTASTLSSAPSTHPWCRLTTSPTTKIPSAGCCASSMKSSRDSYLETSRGG